MDKQFLSFKVDGWTASSILAFKKNDAGRLRKIYKALSVLLRLQARNAVESLVRAEEAERTAKRALKKAEKDGISFLFGNSFAMSRRRVNHFMRANISFQLAKQIGI